MWTSFYFIRHVRHVRIHETKSLQKPRKKLSASLQPTHQPGTATKRLLSLSRMCNTNPPRHRRVQSVDATTSAPTSARRPRPTSARRQRSSSANGARCVAAVSVLPALIVRSPSSTTKVSGVNPTYFKPVLAGVQRRLQRPSSIDRDQKSTLGSLRRQNGTRSLDALAASSHKHSSDHPLKRMKAVHNLWSTARQESGMPESLPKPMAPQIDRFLAGEAVVF